MFKIYQKETRLEDIFVLNMNQRDSSIEKYSGSGQEKPSSS